MMNSALCLAAASLAALSASAQTPIERLAPRNSVFVLGVKNVQESREHLKATSLWSLIKSEMVTQMWADAMADVEPKLDEALAELGVERDAITCPNGALGAALFWVRDEEIGAPYPGLIVYADWGEGADEISSLIEKLLARAEEEQGFSHELIEVAGRSAYRFDLPEEEAPEEAGEEDFDDIDMGGPGMGMGGGMFGDPAAVLENIDAVYYLRSGSAFLLCTDLSSLTDAVELLDGEEHVALADREDFQGVMKQVGSGDLYAAWLTKDATQLLGGPQGIGMAAMFMPLLKQFVGDIHAFGSATRIDGAKAMIEKTTAVYMPNGRSGLTALLDAQTPRTGLPAFAGSDVINYNTLNFEFKGLPILVQQIGQMFPMLPLQAPPGQEGPSPVDMMKEVCGPLGPQIHIVQSATTGPAQPLIAIQCTDPERFEAFLTQSQLIPAMEGKDTEGGRIYTLPLDALGGMPGLPGMEAAPADEELGMETSLGIGSEFMFFGPTAAVENALALPADAKGAPTTDAGAWQRATELLGDGPFIGWGYTDVVSLIEGQMELQKQVMDRAMEQLAADAEGEEEMAEIEQALEDNPVLAAFRQFDWSSLREYLGPSVWEAHTTEQGFIINSYSLAPAARGAE
ncbi:MAG: hypothetical protein JSV91_07750 [Phycisphaerales bacterium]|nr:MAG: hypothetical protein JSV91_07750 [Phycisphaerales bacterium]